MIRSSLPICQIEKPWGKDVLPAPFAAAERRRIGEIWFEPPGALPELLVKYIFTSEALSVQVHPSDVQTARNGLGRQGKDECWLIVAAEAGSRLGIGFDEPIDETAMRAAALDGSIEHLMTWHPVSAGDFFYIPANTVHAIGAGMSLIEVQQNSDITYRLYDYGRPRELHLDNGIAVAKGEPYDLARWHKSVSPSTSMTLVDGPLFMLDQVAGPPSPNMTVRYPGPLLLIPRRGEIHVKGERIAPGACAVAMSINDVHFINESICLLARPSDIF